MLLPATRSTRNSNLCPYTTLLLNGNHVPAVAARKARGVAVGFDERPPQRTRFHLFELGVSETIQRIHGSFISVACVDCDLLNLFSAGDRPVNEWLQNCLQYCSDV